MTNDAQYATRDESRDRRELIRASLDRLENEIRTHDAAVKEIMGRGLCAAEYRSAIAPYNGVADRLLGERDHLRGLLAGLEGR